MSRVSDALSECVDRTLCKLAIFLSQIDDPEERVELEDAIDKKGDGLVWVYGHTVIAAVIKTLGGDVSETLVRNHRAGRCGCKA